MAFRRLVAICLGIVVLAASPLSAIHTRRYALEELCEVATSIHVATVVSAEPVLDASSDSIWTVYKLEIEQTWKGEAVATRELRFFGGELNGRSEGLAGQTRLDVGNRYLLFVRDVEKLYAPVVGVGQGVFRVQALGTDRNPARTVQLISDDGERLDVGNDRKIQRTGPWIAHDGIARNANELASTPPSRERDPDPAQSTGIPSRGTPPPPEVDPSLRPATLAEVREFLVEPVLRGKEH